FERVLARGHLDDREPTDHGFGLRRRPIGDHTVGANDARSLPLKPAAMDPDASILCLSYHRVSCLADGGPLVSRDMSHCAVVERDQIPCHFAAPSPAPLGSPLTDSTA